MTLLRGMVGDVDQIAAGEYLEVKPSDTEEWVIHNIYREAAITIRIYKDDTDFLDIPVTGAGMLSYFAIHVNATQYVRLVNDHATDTLPIAWDGVLSQL